MVNYSHLFPTRYSLELEGLKGILSAETFKEPSQREDSKKQVKKLLEDRYTNGKNKWFFQPLRVRIHQPYTHGPTLTMLAVLISPFLIPVFVTSTKCHMYTHVIRDICPAPSQSACQIPLFLMIIRQAQHCNRTFCPPQLHVVLLNE